MNKIIKLIKTIMNDCWITGSPPLLEGEYLATVKDGKLPMTLWYIDYKWRDNEDNIYNVIAWMPIPDAYSNNRSNVY